jgi:hypothetical protein
MRHGKRVLFLVVLALAWAPCLAEKPAPAFKKLQLTDQFYCEGAYYADFNKDGKMDVVSGPFWYEGPDFQKKHEVRPAKAYDPKAYSDNFLTFTGDFNADGWPDIFYMPYPGKEGYWYENPADPSARAAGASAGAPGTADSRAGSRRVPEEPWKQHLAFPVVDNESPTMGDLNGDGRPELIFNTGGCLGYATFDPAKPDQPWTFHPITPKGKYQKFTHGIGWGDVNGDGRMDIIEAEGWWEQPANAKPDGAPAASADGSWIKHPQKFADAACQMHVYDVDGDGLSDIITSWHCHKYGLVWWKQAKDAKGEVTWQRQVILPPDPDVNSPALRISQLHAIELVDINGDGLKDILTGKRFWSHGPTGDVEPGAPAVVYWFELRRDSGHGVQFIPHLIDDNSGVGTQVAATDLNGDGVPDVIVGNKKGTFIHLSQPGR